MSNTVAYARKCASIKPTPMNKGVEMTIKVVAYDNGVVMVNGNPAGETSFMSASRFILQMMEELQAESDHRTKEVAS